MHCNVKTRCEALKALAQKKLGADDPAVVEITRGGTKVTVDLASDTKVMPGDELRVPSRLF